MENTNKTDLTEEFSAEILSEEDAERILTDENLWKKLSNEALENVAGGDALETADDSRFLNVLFGKCDRYGEPKMRLGNHDQEVIDAWASVGIRAEIHTGNFFTSGDENRYYFNDAELTRKQAMAHAMMMAGRQLKKSDWYW